MIVILIFNINGRITGLPFLRTCVACLGEILVTHLVAASSVLVFWSMAPMLLWLDTLVAVIRPNHHIQYEFLILLVEMLCDDYSVVCI